MFTIIENREGFEAAAKEKWVLIARYGEYPHGESGKVQVFDRAAAEAIKAKFFHEMQGRDAVGVLVDMDHRSYDMSQLTEAAAWAVDLKADDVGLWALIRWTDLGESAVRNGRYQFLSPTFNKADELPGGKVRPTRLDTIALTNRPNMAMPPLSRYEVSLSNRALLANRVRGGAGALVSLPGSREFYGFVLPENAGGVSVLMNRAASLPECPHEAAVLFRALVNRRMVYRREGFGAANDAVLQAHAALAERASKQAQRGARENFLSRLQNRVGTAFEGAATATVAGYFGVTEDDLSELRKRIGFPRVEDEEIVRAHEAISPTALSGLLNAEMVRKLYLANIKKIKELRPMMDTQEAGQILFYAWPELHMLYHEHCIGKSAGGFGTQPSGMVDTYGPISTAYHG